MRVQPKYQCYLTLLVLWSATPAFAASRFRQWFAQSEKVFSTLSTGTCNATLTAYQNAYNTSPHKALVDLGPEFDGELNSLCKAHATCILGQTTDFQKNSLATAAVVLGLLPTLMAVLSPTIPELALLAAQRPLFTALVSLGAPGVLQTRVFEYNDPAELLEVQATGRSRPLIYGPWPSSSRAWLVSVMGIFLVCASAVNTLHLAVELSNRTVFSWGCGRAWPTMLWVISPLLIHQVAAYSYRIMLTQKHRATDTTGLPAATSAPQQVQSSKGPSSTSVQVQPVATPTSSTTSKRSGSATKTPKFVQYLKKLFLYEVTTCASQSPRWYYLEPQPSFISLRVRIGVFLQCCAGFLSFFHLLYGIVTLSGMMFIVSVDALGEISMRFLASVLICRFVVLTEIGGMRGATKATQAPKTA